MNPSIIQTFPCVFPKRASTNFPGASRRIVYGIYIFCLKRSSKTPGASRPILCRISFVFDHMRSLISRRFALYFAQDPLSILPTTVLNKFSGASHRILQRNPFTFCRQRSFKNLPALRARFCVGSTLFLANNISSKITRRFAPVVVQDLLSILSNQNPPQFCGASCRIL